MKKSFFGSLLLSTLLISSVFAVENSEVDFPVSSKYFLDTRDHWASETIEKVIEDSYFVGTGPYKFSPNRIMTKAEFVAVLARVISPDGIYDRLPDEPWYIPYYNAVESKGILPADFERENLDDNIFGKEANFALNVWQQHLLTQAEGTELFLFAHEHQSEASEHFSEADLDDELTRANCAALVYDVTNSDSYIQYLVGIGREETALATSFMLESLSYSGLYEDLQTNFENPSLNYGSSGHRDIVGFDIPATAFPEVNLLLEWTEDSLATPNQNCLARILSKFNFGLLDTINTWQFMDTFGELSVIEEFIDDSFAYISKDLNDGYELIAVTVLEEDNFDYIISVFEDYLNTKVSHYAEPTGEYSLWENHARVLAIGDSVILIAHPDVDLIISEISSWIE